MLNAFALNSHINNDPKYDDDFFLVMDHAIDQGFAFGHGNGTNHHYGYNIRKIYDAMWLMRDKIGRTRQDRRIRQGAGLLERPGRRPANPTSTAATSCSTRGTRCSSPRSSAR